MNCSHSLKVGVCLNMIFGSVDSSTVFFATTTTFFYLFYPAEIWLDWLKDEIRLTEEEPNREKVYELFEKAIKDYICECI